MPPCVPDGRRRVCDTGYTMSLCSVTQGGGSASDSDGGDAPAHAKELGDGGGDDTVLRDHAKGVVVQYLDLSRELDALKEQATAKRKQLQGLEPGVKAALGQLETDALNIRGVGGVDIVQQRRKAVVRVEDYMRQLNVLDPTLATAVKQHVDSKRTFTEKEIIRVVKPKSGE